MGADRQRVFENSAPSYEVGRAMLPGLLGFVGGAMNTEHARGKIVQQGLFFGACVSIGGWGKRKAKYRLLDAGCFIAGAALGFAAKGGVK